MSGSLANPAARMAPAEELACLEQMRRGEPGCLARFFDSWADRLYGLALRLLGDPATAEDVVQEAFLKLMTGASSIEGRSSLSTWLYRVVYNASLDRLRVQKRELPVPEEGVSGGDPAPSLLVDFRFSPEGLARDAELGRALDRAIAELPPLLQAAFVLRDVEGLSTAEAAEAIGVSETNLKVRLHRARLLLRERLSQFAASRGRSRKEGS